jgi:hypothetical protein
VRRFLPRTSTLTLFRDESLTHIPPAIRLLHSRFTNIVILNKRFFFKIKLVADVKSLPKVQASLADRFFQNFGRHVRKITIEVPWQSSHTNLKKYRKRFQQYRASTAERQQAIQDGSLPAAWTEMFEHFPNLCIIELHGVSLGPSAQNNHSEMFHGDQQEPADSLVPPSQGDPPYAPVVPLILTAIASAGIRPTFLSMRGSFHPTNLETSNISNWDLLDLSRVRKIAFEFDLVDESGGRDFGNDAVKADLVAKILVKSLDSLKILKLKCSCEVPPADAAPLPKLEYLKLASPAILEQHPGTKWILGMESLGYIDFTSIGLRKPYCDWRYIFEAIRDHPNSIKLDFDSIISNDWTEFSTQIRVPRGQNPEDLPIERGEASLNGDEDPDQLLMELDEDFEKYMAGRIAWTSSRALEWFFD